jgi:hypothetical protein
MFILSCVVSLVAILVSSFVFKSKIRSYIDNRKQASEKRQKQNSHRLKALLELVQSEHQYVQYLQVYLHNYYEPLMYDDYSRAMKAPESTEENVKYFLDFDKVLDGTCEDLLPPDLTVIYHLSKELLFELEKSILGMHRKRRFIPRLCLKLWNKITKQSEERTYSTDHVIKRCKLGKLFLKFAPAFKLYSEYAGYFAQSRAKLTELQKNAEFKQLITKGKLIPESKGQDLGSLIIMPVQRLPRYLMLSNAVLSCMNTTSKGYDKLKKACDEIQKIIVYVDKRVEDIHHMLDVCKFHHEFNTKYPELNLVEPSRRLLTQTTVHDYSNSDDHTGYRVMLFNNLLVVTQVPKPKRTSIYHVVINTFSAPKIEVIPVYVCSLSKVRLHEQPQNTKLELNEVMCYSPDLTIQSHVVHLYPFKENHAKDLITRLKQVL